MAAPIDTLFSRARELAGSDFYEQQKVRRIEYLLSTKRYAALFDEGLFRWMQDLVQEGKKHGNAA